MATALDVLLRLAAPAQVLGVDPGPFSFGRSVLSGGVGTGGPLDFGRSVGLGSGFESSGSPYQQASAKASGTAKLLQARTALQQQAAAKPGAQAQGVAQAANVATAFGQLAPYADLIQQAATTTQTPPQLWQAAIMSESEGNPNAVNPTSLATGLLQNLPTESPSGRGRGYGYSSAELRDPALNLRLAYPEFQQAWQATAGIRDPIERATQTIGRAQRYEGYLEPQSPANQRVRGYVQRAFSQAVGQQVAQGQLPTPGGTAQAMLAKAQEWVQAAPRYALEGGATTRQAADCSGLIVGIMRELGTPFAPGVRTAEQIRQQSVPVAVGQAQPGDLIFFQGTYNSGEGPNAATHVGIVTDQGVMLDTNDARGRPGTTSYLTPYWQQHFLEIRRPPQYAQGAFGAP